MVKPGLPCKMRQQNPPSSPPSRNASFGNAKTSRSSKVSFQEPSKASQKKNGEPEMKNGNSKTYAKHMHNINNWYALLNIVQYSTYLGCTRMYYISSWLSRFHRKANMTYLFSQLLLLGEDSHPQFLFSSSRLRKNYCISRTVAFWCILDVRVIFSEPRDFYSSLP